MTVRQKQRLPQHRDASYIEAVTSAARTWINLMSGLWFDPTVIVALLIVGAVAITEGRQARQFGTPSCDWPRLLAADATSAREMLSSISTSIITIAGVVFSIAM